MGEAFITRRGGGKPKPPASWMFFQLITDSRTWAVPTDAWYKIYCVGRSGNGGNGLTGYPEEDRNRGSRGGGGGGGGGSGGVSIYTVFLKEGTAIPVTVNGSVTSFESRMSATAGGNGGVGTTGVSLQGGSPGVPGQAFGGNVANSTGLCGGVGGKGGVEDNHTPWYLNGQPGESVGGNTGGTATGNYVHDGGGGGSGNNLQSLGGYFVFTNKYGGNGGTTQTGILTTHPWSAPQSMSSPPILYGSGGGGGGGGLGTGVQPPTPGGMGTPGCIIIEKGVE